MIQASAARGDRRRLAAQEGRQVVAKAWSARPRIVVLGIAVALGGPRGAAVALGERRDVAVLRGGVWSVARGFPRDVLARLARRVLAALWRRFRGAAARWAAAAAALALEIEFGGL